MSTRAKMTGIEKRIRWSQTEIQCTLIWTMLARMEWYNNKLYNGNNTKSNALHSYTHADKQVWETNSGVYRNWWNRNSNRITSNTWRQKTCAKLMATAIYKKSKFSTKPETKFPHSFLHAAYSLPFSVGIFQ